MLTQNLGYPRIGANRELKKACESYWKGKITLQELEDAGKQERLKNWQIQQKAGIGLIPSNDFSFYDQVVEWCFTLGVIPPRFETLTEKLPPRDLYFAMCRGYQVEETDVTPLEMTKWFDTNYHYLVPEFEKNQDFSLKDTKVIDEFCEALSLGIKTKPVLLGPVTFLMLGKEKHNDFNRLELIRTLLPIYIQLVGMLENSGAECIQIDEPFLVTELTDYEKQVYRVALTELCGNFPGIKFVLATYFGSIAHNIDLIAGLPLEVLHIDMVRGQGQLDAVLEKIPQKMSLSLGIVDGRNIWKNDLTSSLEIIKKATNKIGKERVMLSPSCSLLHVPYDLEMEHDEKGLPLEVKNRMAHAHQKLDEVVLLAELCNSVLSEETLLKQIANHQIIESWKTSELVNNADVKQKVCAIAREKENISRNSPFSERIKMQQQKLNLPLFPTTMIGSLPQTDEVRSMRRKFINGQIGKEEYRQFVESLTRKAIEWQDEIGIDVLVHGEFERNDMVEYFGEQLNGFAFTQNGWVQSYGSRGVKPPVIYGDVSRKGPMTVEMSLFAQMISKKPVKGMLTGPITILQWSFVRDDQPRETTATQIALAIRDEVLDLEQSGIGIIQIDEPALREGLPLKKSECPEYLNWAVRAFKLSYWGVKDETQIHTHMCYCEFNDIIGAIAEMDADVISIETAARKWN
jgi:5-methyltetrahydropteroyltriglutamate--homocysteine methyltransferase